MASSVILLVCSMLAAIVSTTTLAAEYIVGDATGWTKGFDYKIWAKDKEFRVGDKLVFKYAAGNHNVLRVNAIQFKNCQVPPGDVGLSTGNDIITLSTPGVKWYTCGFPGHCESGQKLAIYVWPEPQIALSPYMGPDPPLAPYSDMNYN